MKRLSWVILLLFLALSIQGQAKSLPFQVLLLNVSNNGGQQVTVKYQSLVKRISPEDLERDYALANWIPFTYFNKNKSILYRGTPMKEWPLDYFRSIEDKAQEYYRVMVRDNALDTVLIGFSQYGLVVRRMAQIDTELWRQKLIPAPRIRGIVTLMTPHQGIPVFDPDTLARVYYRLLGFAAKTLRDARFEDLLVMAKAFTGKPLELTGSSQADRLGFYWLLDPLIRAFKDFGDLQSLESSEDKENFLKGLEGLKSSLEGFGLGSALIGPLGLDKISHPDLEVIIRTITQLTTDIKTFGKGPQDPIKKHKISLDLIGFVGSFIRYLQTDGGSSFLSLGWTAYPVLRVHGTVLDIDSSLLDFNQDRRSPSLFQSCYDMRSPKYDSPDRNPFWDRISNNNFIGNLNRRTERPMKILNLIGNLGKVPPVLKNLDLDPQGKSPAEDWAQVISDGKDFQSDGMVPRSYAHYPGHETSPEFKEIILPTVNHFNFSDRVYPEVINIVENFLESLK